MDNLANYFRTNVRINNLDSLDPDAVWPKNIEICITRVPIRKKDGFNAEKLKKIAEKLKTNMMKDGIVFMICYAPVEAKARPFEVADLMVKAGFNHIDNIIIQKSWFPGKRSESNLVNSHEYVLYFCNGKVWKLDRNPIREYLKTDDDVSCPGNLWKIETGSLEESYPVELAELLMRMTDCLPGSLIFDPFMATKSSLVASLKLGHSFVGFESDNAKVKQYQKVIEKFKNGDKL